VKVGNLRAARHMGKPGISLGGDLGRGRLSSGRERSLGTRIAAREKPVPIFVALAALSKTVDD